MNEQPKTLSNPVLDEAYAMRRVFVGQWNLHRRLSDAYAMDYHRRKVEALDLLVETYIVANPSIEASHIEAGLQPLPDAHIALAPAGQGAADLSFMRTGIKPDVGL